MSSFRCDLDAKLSELHQSKSKQVVMKSPIEIESEMCRLFHNDLKFACSAGGIFSEDGYVDSHAYGVLFGVRQTTYCHKHV